MGDEKVRGFKVRIAVNQPCDGKSGGRTDRQRT